MAAVYTHTNIISRDVERLAAFYTDVFGCVPSGPERILTGDWIGRGTGHPGIEVRGVHLRLPGHGEDGPTLEILTVTGLQDGEPGTLQRTGYTHMAFVVEDVRAVLAQIVEHGGSLLGEVVLAQPVEGLGQPDFVYARDPDGNILELLDWKAKLA